MVTPGKEVNYEEYLTPNMAEFIGNDDSESIQNAIDFAAKNKISSVLIPRFNKRSGSCMWEISETILIHSDITLLLDNCHMIMADGVMCNMFRNSAMYSELSCTNKATQYNITIKGLGYSVLDGGNSNGLIEANSGKNGLPIVRNNNLILFHNVKNFNIENIEVRNQRWWALNFIFCSNGHIADITSYADNRIPNQDAVNLRIGCNNITVERITGQSGDDLVALTALSGTDLKLAVEGSDIDIHDIVIRDIIGTSVRQAVVALRAQDDSKLYNILAENIIESNGGDHNNIPYGVVRVGQNNYFKVHESPMGSIHNITVRNVYSSVGKAVSIGANLLDSVFENINATGGDYVFSTTDYDAVGGVKMRNVVIDGVSACESLKHSPIDFGTMRGDDFIDGLEIKNLNYKGKNKPVVLNKDVPNNVTLEGEKI